MSEEYRMGRDGGFYQSASPRTGAMIGASITTAQMETIMRISENVNVKFAGEDRYDAYQYINRYMEESRRIEELKESQQAMAPKKAKRPAKKIAVPDYEEKSIPELETTKIEKRGNSMLNNIKSIMGEFGKITTDQFKLSFQGIAVRTEKPSADSAASYAVYDAANNRMIDVMDFVLDAQGMLFKLPAVLNQLKKGDIIIVKEKPLVVKSVNLEAQSIRALNPLSNNETTHKPAGNLFGFQFITKVSSMFELMQGGQQFNPLMMMALVGDSKEDSKMSDMLPFLMMGGMQTGANPMAQMLPFMLMQGDGKNSNIMETMMLAQMFNGGGGFAFPQQPVQPVQQAPQQAFGFGNLFGGGFPQFHPNTPASPGNVDAEVDTDSESTEE